MLTGDRGGLTCAGSQRCRHMMGTQRGCAGDSLLHEGCIGGVGGGALRGHVPQRRRDDVWLLQTGQGHGQRGARAVRVRWGGFDASRGPCGFAKGAWLAQQAGAAAKGRQWRGQWPALN